MNKLRDQSGELGATLIIFPAVLLAINLAIHGALVYHGRQVVTAAAQDGLRAAQQDGANESDGYSAANATLALDSGLHDTSITINRGPDTVTVTVVGKVWTPIVDAFALQQVTIEGPVERFYSQQERR